MSEFASVPAIVVVCYLIAEVVKQIFGEKVHRFIPCICGITGGLIGLLVFFTIPGFINTDYWIVALATGIISGLSATGVNQLYKQLKSE